jgi:hypothetical protein
MSIHLVRRWRRTARDWNDVAERAVANEKPPAECERAFAYARILRECAESLERSLIIAARKRRASKGAP